MTTGEPGGVIVSALCLKTYRTEVPLRIDPDAAGRITATNARFITIRRRFVPAVIALDVICAAFQVAVLLTMHGASTATERTLVLVAGILFIVVIVGGLATILNLYRLLNKNAIPQHPVYAGGLVRMQEINGEALQGWAQENPGVIRVDASRIMTTA